MHRRIALLVACAGLAAPLAARAQSKDDVARADALFNAAKALTDSGQYADACAKFAESKRLAPGLGVTLYLADCYERIGRTASAWTEFRAAEGLARQRNDKRADVARQHAQSLEPKLDRLTISVAPTLPRAGLSILRDGVPVSNEELGLAVPVDPGDHVVVVASPGHPQRTFNSHVSPDSPNATVAIDRLDDAPAPTPAPVPAPSPNPAPSPAPTPTPTTDSTSSPPGSTQRLVGIGAMGVGAAGVVLGSVFGVLAKSALDASNNGPCNSTDHCNGAGLSDRQDASTKATVSTVSFIAGGVLLAGGAALYFTAPRGPHASSGAGVLLAPSPLVGGCGALVRGWF
jgi:hypothetical protein